jgi:phosphatidylglycerol---prolipoprotein diacylglyceryl transferase
MRQILFQLGPLKFYSYGLMLGISFALGIHLALWRARREGVSQDNVFTIAMGIVIVSLIGSKLLHLLVNFKDFLDHPMNAIKHFGGGFVFFGGFLAAMIFVLVMARRYHINILQLFDIYSPSVAIGLGITRIGCFLSGCCFGLPTDLPWAVTFPEGSFAFRQYGGFVGVHPTQLYESFYSVFIFLLLLAFLKYRGKRFHGQVFLIFGTLYSICRFSVEFVRGDLGRGIYFSLSTSQYIGIFMVLLCIALMVIVPRNPRNILSPRIYL